MPPPRSRDARTESWLRWLRQQLATGDVPILGSPAFDRLPGDDPLRRAAVVDAAFCWWHESRPERIAEKLRDEIAVADQIEAAAFADVAARVRRLANQPTWAEIQRQWAS